MTRTELDRRRMYRNSGQRLTRLVHLCKARFRNSQRNIVQWLGRTIPENGVIIDIGAQFGNFTKAFSRLHAGSCSVHAFEPLDYNYRILESVTAGLGNVRLYRMALSDRSGMTDLFIPVKARGRLGPGLAHFGEETRRDYIREPVATQRLDDVIETMGITRLDFIKCDIEGSELPALRGAAAVLRHYRPVIYAEINAAFTARLGYSPNELFTRLRDLGYDAQLVDEDKLTARRVHCCSAAGNYLFTPR